MGEMLQILIERDINNTSVLIVPKHSAMASYKIYLCDQINLKLNKSYFVCVSKWGTD